MFGGPSLYFHQRALATRGAPTSREHLEYVYATLAAWGMHRMGRGGSKMVEFDVFRASVEPLGDAIRQAQLLNADTIDTAGMEPHQAHFLRHHDHGEWDVRIVGNSKVMHHMLPNIVPPIDRRYTLRYVRGTTFLKNDFAAEWELMRSIISDVFLAVARNDGFKTTALAWVADSERFPWDTSVTKVIDNLSIGARRASTRASTVVT